MPLTNLKIAVILGVLSLILGVCIYISFLHTKIDKLEAQLALEKQITATLEIRVKELTEAEIEAKHRAYEADKRRQEVAAKLSATLQQLRNQRPPTKCEDAVKWSIDNKGDLKW